MKEVKSMENRNSNEFDRTEYLRGFIVKFLQSQHKAKSEIVGNLNLLNRNQNTLNHSEKRQILERLDKLFSKPEFVKLVQKEKQNKRNSRTRCCIK